MKKDAVVGEAEAKRDSTIAEAKANEQKMQVKTFNIKLDINLDKTFKKQKMQVKTVSFNIKSNLSISGKTFK